MINYTINQAGMEQIRQFLHGHHAFMREDITETIVNAYAAEAEFSLCNGNPAIIEIPPYRSKVGRA